MAELGLGRWEATYNKSGAKIWVDGRPMFAVIAGLEDSRVTDENPVPRWRQITEAVVDLMNRQTRSQS